MFKRGQVMFEYILLLGLVAVLVMFSFRQNGVITQTVNASRDYYKVGSRAILGGFYDANGKVVMQDPAGSDGGWCDFSVCVNGVRVRECACPRPAFKGKECLDDVYGGAVTPWMDGHQAQCAVTAPMCDASLNMHYIPGIGCGCYDTEQLAGGRCVAKCTPECANGKQCVNGACVCQSPQAMCSGTCLNLASDNNNCGACGKRCTGTKTCKSCVCS